jgi:hypothetical protein
MSISVNVKSFIFRSILLMAVFTLTYLLIHKLSESKQGKLCDVLFSYDLVFCLSFPMCQWCPMILSEVINIQILYIWGYVVYITWVLCFRLLCLQECVLLTRTDMVWRMWYEMYMWKCHHWLLYLLSKVYIYNHSNWITVGYIK